jgi:Tfp pilus assembly protein PilO
VGEGLREYLIVLGGGLLAIAAVTVLAVIPARVKLAEAQGQLERVENEVGHRRRRLMPLGRLDVSVRKLDTELKSSRKALPDRDELGNILGRVNRIVESQRLTDLEITPSEPVARGDVYRMPMRLTFAGTLTGLFAFLRELEGLPHYIRVDELKIENDARYSGRVTVTLEVSVFFRRDAKG